MRKKILLIYVFGICVFATFALLSQTMKLPEVIEDNEEVFKERPTEDFLIKSIVEEFDSPEAIEIIDCVLADDLAQGLAGVVIYKEVWTEDNVWSTGFIDEYGIVEFMNFEGFKKPDSAGMTYQGDGIVQMEVVESDTQNSWLLTMTYEKNDFNATIDTEFNSMD